MHLSLVLKAFGPLISLLSSKRTNRNAANRHLELPGSERFSEGFLGGACKGFLGRAKGDAPKVTEPNLRFPAVCCENLRFPAKICDFLRFPAPSKCWNFQEKG